MLIRSGLCLNPEAEVVTGGADKVVPVAELAKVRDLYQAERDARAAAQKELDEYRAKEKAAAEELAKKNGEHEKIANAYKAEAEAAKAAASKLERKFAVQAALLESGLDRSRLEDATLLFEQAEPNPKDIKESVSKFLESRPYFVTATATGTPSNAGRQSGAGTSTSTKEQAAAEFKAAQEAYKTGGPTEANTRRMLDARRKMAAFK